MSGEHYDFTIESAHILYERLRMHPNFELSVGNPHMKPLAFLSIVVVKFGFTNLLRARKFAVELIGNFQPIEGSQTFKSLVGWLEATHWPSGDVEVPVPEWLRDWPELLNFRPFWGYLSSDPCFVVNSEIEDLEFTRGPIHMKELTEWVPIGDLGSIDPDTWGDVDFECRISIPYALDKPVPCSMGESYYCPPRLSGLVGCQHGWIVFEDFIECDRRTIFITAMYAHEMEERSMGLGFLVQPTGLNLPVAEGTFHLAGIYGWLHSLLEFAIEYVPCLETEIRTSEAWSVVEANSDIHPLFSRWVNKGATC